MTITPSLTSVSLSLPLPTNPDPPGNPGTERRDTRSAPFQILPRALRQGSHFAAKIPPMDPILLIHGFPLDSSMWDAQAAFLRARGLTVLTPDLPGFNNTPPLPPDRSSIDDFAEFIRDQILALPGKRAMVGGFSMGGYILLSLLNHHPELVSASLFFDTRADADLPEARQARLDSIQRITSGDIDGFFDASLTRMLRKKPDPAIKSRARAIMQRQPAATVIAAQLAMARRRSHTHLLPEITVPTMIVVGAEDVITPPSVALNMQSHMPHAMVVQVVNAGHLAVLEQADAVNGHLAAFLATVRPAPQVPA